MVGCFPKSASPGVPVAGSKGTVVASGWTMRHFEFHDAGRLGMHLRPDCYPIEVEKVDEGSAAHYRGVPQDSIMFRVNGRRLSPTDGEEERERVRKEFKVRPLSFDVVLRCAPGLRSLAGGLPAVPGKAGVVRGRQGSQA